MLKFKKVRSYIKAIKLKLNLKKLKKSLKFIIKRY